MTMFVAIVNNTVSYQKELIDALIERVHNSRVNYIFRTVDPYRRLIKFIDDDMETRDAVLKHRFYVEYKIKDVISNDR